MSQKTKYYDLRLHYYKQGDDLSMALQRHPDNTSVAFLEHAENLEASAKRLRRMAAVASEHELEVHADCHFIGIGCSEELGNTLVEEGLLYPSPIEDEEEDWSTF